MQGASLRLEKEDYTMDFVIFGAKSLALGVYDAMRNLYPEYPVKSFLVSSKQGNPDRLAGLPVKEIEELSCEAEAGNIHVLIGTPQDLHGEIIGQLKKYGFCNYTCIDSHREAFLMERYFMEIKRFPSIHNLCFLPNGSKASLQVYMAKFHKDRPLLKEYAFPSWVIPLQVGAALTPVDAVAFKDNIGDNISGKNGNYCELTALYWLWKNQLENNQKAETAEYYGLFHYRRVLDITDEDVLRIKGNDVDAVLPFPTLHEPDIREHHARYIGEGDWDAAVQALKELQPDYAEAFDAIMSQPYFYNYNLIIAKRSVLENYCSWLFPILGRTEELSNPKGWDRADRYIGYIAESLMTLYFLYHQKDLRIYHTGRRMLN